MAKLKMNVYFYVKEVMILEPGSRLSIKKFTFLMLAFIIPWLLVFIIGESSIGYSVSINDKCIAYIRHKSDLDNVFNELKTQLGNRVNLIDTPNNVTFDFIFSSKDNFIKEEELKNALLNYSTNTIKGSLIKVDDHPLTYILNNEEANYILESIKNYYINTLKEDKSSITNCSIKNKISYEAIDLSLKDIKGLQQCVDELISSESKKPLFNVEVKINKKESLTINPNLSIKTSADMDIGTNKVAFNGECGLKDVVKESIYLNNNLVSEKIISEKIIKEPKDKIVVKGINGPLPQNKEVAFIEKPSRGLITSNFGERWGKNHKGIDIAGNIGDPINCPLDGTVTYSGWMDGYGNVIILNHGNGLETRYGHCSKLNVKKNDKIKKNDIIALIGNTGNSTGPHLHFEVRKNGEAVNPINYIIN